MNKKKGGEKTHSNRILIEKVCWKRTKSQNSVIIKRTEVPKKKGGQVGIATF